MTDHALIIADRSIEHAIQIWLHDKEHHSGSLHTWRAYEQTIRSFRVALASRGLDLAGDPHAVALVAQVWASARRPNVQRGAGDVVKGATYNQRLACLSSFYGFVIARDLTDIPDNPIAALAKRSEADREQAPVFAAAAIGAKLR
jgi:site-specific recombinase XerD